MKCIVCGREVEEGGAFCISCGFPMVVPLGKGNESDKQLIKMAEEYRLKICNDIEVGVYAYSHEIHINNKGEEVIKMKKADKLPLGVCGELDPNKIYWNPEAFVRPHKKSLVCNVYIRQEDKEKGPIKQDIPLQPGKDDIYIGIKLVRTGVVKLCVGTESSYSESGEIDVLT